jgi:lysyl-tRNA synthetase, class II
VCKPTAMSQEEGVQEKKLYDERLAKAQGWRTHGLNPYGNGFRPKNTCHEVTAKHEKDDGASLEATKAGPYVLAGRVVAMRSFGKAAFVHIQDRTGTLQLHVKADVLGAQFAPMAEKLIDVGDFVGVEGSPFRSKTGELTLAVTAFRPLSKSLRPMPGKFAASEAGAKFVEENVGSLSDVEQRYRQRYLDLLANKEVRETFKKRSALVQYIRHFLDQRDYLEVETPMMHSLVSGAAARPFRTHHNTLDIDLYMRIAPELHLKRLVVGGFDRVYEINRNFRNEGISTRHNPEFTMLEFYEAYATYEDLMNLTEEMIAGAAAKVCGSAKVQYGEHTIDFSAGWRRIPMWEAIREKVPLLAASDLTDTDKLRAVALQGAEKKEAAAIGAMNHGELIGALFERFVEHTLIQPTFVTQFPVEVSPLARRNDAQPAVTDRFELFCVGREIANAFSELNDPIDQAGRFKAQLDAKARGQDETMDYDADYIRALEHGLPPTAGEGIGIDRLAMLFTNAQSIRDVILFPLLKPQAT